MLNDHKCDKNEITSLKQDSNTTNHNFNFEPIKILTKDNNCSNLRIYERLHIKPNQKTYTKNVNNIYNHLIHPNPLKNSKT